VETFFQQNETVIVFAHGLVLFALGFAAWLQRRRATRLALTSSLIWLASYAFFEALVIWGFVFIPIQSTYLAPEVIQSLVVLRAVLQLVAVACLLQFGLRLVPWTRRHLVLFTIISMVVWVGILVGATAAAGNQGWDVIQWEATTAQFSRYLFLVPGALLSAYGMWLQRDALTRAGMVGIRPFAALAAAALLVYAVVGGIVVQPAPWAPAGLGNESGWFDITGFPLAVVRGLVALALLLAVIKLLDIFEVEAEQQVMALDRARLVAEERARFGRDLHDGTIQSIYASGLHLEAIALNTDDGDTRDEIRHVVGSLNATIDGLRGYIRGLQAPDGGPAGIASDLDRIVRDFRDDSHLEVAFRVTGQESCGPLPDDAGQHLAHILRESLANVSRHAGPCAVDVRLAFSPDEVDLVVSDTGGGIRDEIAGPAAPGHGNGLKNMHERARWLGGRIVIEPGSTGGTRVVLAVPLDDVESTEMPATRQGSPTEVMS
jgi:signal transduction histidine kinase